MKKIIEYILEPLFELIPGIFVAAFFICGVGSMVEQINAHVPCEPKKEESRISLANCHKFLKTKKSWNWKTLKQAQETYITVSECSLLVGSSNAKNY